MVMKPTLYNLIVDIFDLKATGLTTVTGTIELVDDSGEAVLDFTEDYGIWQNQTRLITPVPSEAGEYTIAIVPTVDLPNAHYRLTFTNTHNERMSVVEFDMPAEDAKLSEIVFIGDVVDTFGTDALIPPGGNTGQVLAKKSPRDRDVEWRDDQQGSGTGGGQSAQQVADAINTHNHATDAHEDIRTLVSDEATARNTADTRIEGKVDARADIRTVGSGLNLASDGELTATGGGGSGDVTTAQFEAEQAARKAGDEIQFSQVTTAANIQSAIDEARTELNILHVVTGSDRSTIVFGGDTYKHGQLIFLAPGQNSLEAGPVIPDEGVGSPILSPINSAAAFRILVQTHVNRASPSWLIAQATYSVTVNSSTYNIKDGDIWHLPPFSDTPTRFWNTRDLGGDIGITPDSIDAIGDLSGDYRMAVYNLNTDYLTARGVRQYEIWVGQRGVHTVSNWTPTADFTVDFNINTSEQTTIGLKATDTIVPVQWVPRLPSGSAENSMIKTTYLRIGASGGLTPEQEKAIEDNTSALAKINETGWVTARRQEKRLQVADLHIIVTPKIRASTAGAYTISFVNSEVVDTASTFYQVALNGVVVQERTAWNQPASITVTPTAQQIAPINQASSTQVSVSVEFYQQASSGLGAGSVVDIVPIQPDTADWAQDGNKDKIPEDKLPDGAVIRAATAPANVGNENKLWYDTTNRRLYTNEPRVLNGREPMGGDFRGSGYRWRGIVADRAARLAFTGTANRDAVFQVDVRQFWVSDGNGGWSAMAFQHYPNSWIYFTDFATAQASDQIGTNQMVLYGTSGLGLFVTSITPQRWVLYERIRMQRATQAEYDAITTKDENTLYLIVG